MYYLYVCNNLVFKDTSKKFLLVNGTALIIIPEIEFEMEPGTLGSRFTTTSQCEATLVRV